MIAKIDGRVWTDRGGNSPISPPADPVFVVTHLSRPGGKWEASLTHTNRITRTVRSFPCVLCGSAAGLNIGPGPAPSFFNVYQQHPFKTKYHMGHLKGDGDKSNVSCWLP